ncbi:hypothetical protein [Peribacillus sp. YIM B13482]|uniref:hypothetical protein n=1 Tax=Peribacillus sp. YIM B13482 TaxID=3366298 RepID=UPI000B65AD7D|nr:hypothetical protein SAMN05444672_10825 [Bacillus sp. OK838]
MKAYFPLYSFIISIALVVIGVFMLIDNTAVFRSIMIVGTISALLLAYFSEKGKWRSLSFGFTILVSIVYYIGVEFIGFLFRSGGFGN